MQEKNVPKWAGLIYDIKIPNFDLSVDDNDLEDEEISK